MTKQEVRNMPDFIDARLRVRSDRLGDLVIAVATTLPYAQFVGVDIVKELTVSTPSKAYSVQAGSAPLLLEPPKAKTQRLKKPKSEYYLPKQQRKIYEAIKKGAADIASIKLHTKANRPIRSILSLKAKKLIKGTDGTYTVEV
jgi:hypothetical protein